MVDIKKRRATVRRPLALAGAFALALSLLPATAGADEHDVAVARGLDGVCPPPAEFAMGDSSDLQDVDGTTHEAAINCVVEYGVVQGYPDDTFRPGDDVTRGQAATFVANLIEVAMDEDLPVPDDDQFEDVGTTHADAINALADAGIVSGLGDGTFGTHSSINRGQMTRIIVGAIDYADDGEVDGSLPQADDTVYFGDADGTTFQAEIQALAGAGVVVGVSENMFVPRGNVTRGQMSSFVARAADFLDEQQRFFPTSVEVTYEVMLAAENEVDGDTGELGAGEPDATATATITVDAFFGEIDWEVDINDVTGPFTEAPGFHIHEGGLSENGGIVVFFADGAALQAAADDDGIATGTFTEDADEFRLANLVNDPDAYYLNVHSDGFPAGAVRGQLPDGGQDLLEPVTYELALTGVAEVDADGTPGQGELAASADATLEIDAVAGTIEHSIEFADVTGPFDAAPGYHIHVGASDENGPVVLFLATATQIQAAANDDGMFSTTIEDVDAELLRRLITEPESYYVNLHSNDFPAGAVRAQLES